jgi:transcription elongation factor Elf1
MDAIKSGDYVIAIKNIKAIQVNAVGLVKVVDKETTTVFFVGLNQVIEVPKEYVAYLDIDKTGKPYDKKICNICHLLKDISEFDINQTDAKGRKTTRPSCKICRIDIDGVALLPSEKKRLKATKPKGIFTCPICQKTTIVDVTVKLVIDHDHKTGNARAWICDSCNTGLGRFKDDVELFEAIIKYLKLQNL